MSEKEDKTPTFEPNEEGNPLVQKLIRALGEPPDVRLSPKVYADTVTMAKAEFFRRASIKRSRREARRKLFFVFAAAALLIIGILIGQFIFISPELRFKENNARQSQLMRVAALYLEEVTPLLVMLSNIDQRRGELPINPNDGFSRDLAFQARYLRSQGDKFLADKNLQPLLDELDVLLTEMINLDLQEPGNLEHLQEMIKTRDLLFKVKFLAMRLNQDKRSQGGGI